MPDVIETTHCKNCNAPLAGEWCQQCGQRLITKRLTVRNAFGQLFDAITNLDRGFWHTMWELTVRPGGVIKDYINGVTRPYFPPFRYAFILVTISTVLTVSSGIFEMQQAEFMQIEGNEPGTGQAMQQEIQAFIGRFLNLFVIVILPFNAFGTWLFTRRQKFNYAEHFVANTFLIGQTSLYGMVFLPFYFIWPESIPYSLALSVIISTTVLMLAFNQWMGIDKGEATARGLLATVFALFSMMIALFILGIVGVLVYLGVRELIS